MADQKKLNQLLLNSQLSANFEQRVLQKIKRYRKQRQITVALITILISAGAILIGLKINHQLSDKNNYIARTENSADLNFQQENYALEELHFVTNSSEANYLYEEYYIKQPNKDQI